MPAAPTSLYDYARHLAQLHKATDPDLAKVFFVDDPAKKEVRLVEVTGSVGTTGEVMPIRFAADPSAGATFPTVLVLLSEEEYALLGTKELSLPDDWTELEQLLPQE